LAGGVRYYDAETDDARLTLANARAALGEGATILTYCAVRAMERAGSEILLDVTDVLSGNEGRLRARLVVNAAGPWCDSVIRMLDSAHKPVIHGSAGAHIAVPRGRIGNHHALTLISPADGRILFVLPNGPTSVIGTTDKTSTGSPDEVRAAVEDIDYLLAAVNRYFPGARLQRSDVLSTWAGIRPLAARYFGGDTSSASREHELRWTSGVMLSVLGGKLTTYRVVARHAVAQLRRKLGRETSEAIHPEQLPGGAFASLDAEREAAVQAVGDGDIGRHLVDAHGSEWRDVWRLALADTTLGRRLHPAHPYLRAEVAFAVRAELALQPADVLLRRMHLAFETRDHGASVLQDVAGIMAAELGWSRGERSQALASFHREVERTFGYAPS
jgi:glycerol-3-phosphate dehydrogenase